MIPYGRQDISNDDIQAVIDVLGSDFITQGPMVPRFEEAVAKYCGAKFAVAVANGTAALHLAALAAEFGPEDQIITSPITFVATANSIIYSGAAPVFADIDSKTYCIDPKEIKRQLTSKTKGIIPVHFAGQPCDMAAIHSIAKKNDLIIIEDAAHAIGASYKIDGETYKVGSCSHSDMTIFSFHPVKHITTGEGGMITTNREDLYEKIKLLRAHGITKNLEHLYCTEGPWYYEQQMLGFNYRITDFQCALGLSQLRKLDDILNRRRNIAESYNDAFINRKELIIPFARKDVISAWHLYVIQLKNLDRLGVFNALRAKGLEVNVHYIPVHLHPYYADKYGYKKGAYPKAESYYQHAVTLPLYPGMTDNDVEYVINKVHETLNEAYR